MPGFLPEHRKTLCPFFCAALIASSALCGGSLDPGVVSVPSISRNISFILSSPFRKLPISDGFPLDDAIAEPDLPRSLRLGLPRLIEAFCLLADHLQQHFGRF